MSSTDGLDSTFLSALSISMWTRNCLHISSADCECSKHARVHSSPRFSVSHACHAVFPFMHARMHADCFSDPQFGWCRSVSGCRRSKNDVIQVRRRLAAADPETTCRWPLHWAELFAVRLAREDQHIFSRRSAVLQWKRQVRKMSVGATWLHLSAMFGDLSMDADHTFFSCDD